MSLKDVLVFLDAADASERRFQLATGIAHDLGASLSAVFVRGKEAPGITPEVTVLRRGLVPQLVPEVVDLPPSTSPGEVAEQRYRQCATSAERRWYEIEATDSDQLIALARAADLIVMGQSNHRPRVSGGPRPDHIVMNCGRPVLIVPYIGSYPEIGRRVLVAWDGSREAVRAVNDAIPMMGRAKAVTLVRVFNGDGSRTGDRETAALAIHHLASHGISARLANTPRGSGPVADVLLSRAMDLSADMIVAGAFHRSPLRETLVGGVSRGLLQRMTVPVLMSH
jgi:nucleotide-binding universal stress UspA family protein